MLSLNNDSLATSQKCETRTLSSARRIAAHRLRNSQHDSNALLDRATSRATRTRLPAAHLRPRRVGICEGRPRVLALAAAAHLLIYDASNSSGATSIRSAI